MTEALNSIGRKMIVDSLNSKKNTPSTQITQIEKEDGTEGQVINLD